MIRIVNIRFKCCGYSFDAAVDCYWSLHCYHKSSDEREEITPIELYNFDEPDWGIKMVYQKGRNDQSEEYGHTVVDLNNIKKEARKWVREMRHEKQKL